MGSASESNQENAEVPQVFERGESSSNAEPSKKLTDFGAIEVSPKEGYVVSISGKKKLRRLHFRGACHRIPGSDYLDFEDYGHKQPKETHYDDYCHQCWGDGNPVDAGVDSVHTESESSSSGSAA